MFSLAMFSTKFAAAPRFHVAIEAQDPEPKALNLGPSKKRLVLSAYYAPKFGALTRDACRRHRCRPLLQRHETDAPQVRGEIWNGPPHQQDFAVQRGNETRNRHAFQRGDLLENAPKHPFEPDTRALPIEPD